LSRKSSIRSASKASFGGELKEEDGELVAEPANFVEEGAEELRAIGQLALMGDRLGNLDREPEISGTLSAHLCQVERRCGRWKDEFISTPAKRLA
jgi:hypothetical protein